MELAAASENKTGLVKSGIQGERQQLQSRDIAGKVTGPANRLQRRLDRPSCSAGPAGPAGRCGPGTLSTAAMGVLIHRGEDNAARRKLARGGTTDDLPAFVKAAVVIARQNGLAQAISKLKTESEGT